MTPPVVCLAGRPAGMLCWAEEGPSVCKSGPKSCPKFHQGFTHFHEWAIANDRPLCSQQQDPIRYFYVAVEEATTIAFGCGENPRAHKIIQFFAISWYCRNGSRPRKYCNTVSVLPCQVKLTSCVVKQTTSFLAGFMDVQYFDAIFLDPCTTVVLKTNRKIRGGAHKQCLTQPPPLTIVPQPCVCVSPPPPPKWFIRESTVSNSIHTQRQSSRQQSVCVMQPPLLPRCNNNWPRCKEQSGDIGTEAEWRTSDQRLPPTLTQNKEHVCFSDYSI